LNKIKPKGYNMAIKFKVLSDENKYSIADAIAKGFNATQYKTMEHNTLFGIIINLVDDTNKSLIQIVGEDNASHITNLAIRRIQQPSNNKFIGSFLGDKAPW
jgi:hypothetical protein